MILALLMGPGSVLQGGAKVVSLCLQLIIKLLLVWAQTFLVQNMPKIFVLKICMLLFYIVASHYLKKSNWREKKITQNPWLPETKKILERIHKSNVKSPNNCNFWYLKCFLVNTWHFQRKIFGLDLSADSISIDYSNFVKSSQKMIKCIKINPFCLIMASFCQENGSSLPDWQKYILKNWIHKQISLFSLIF